MVSMLWKTICKNDGAAGEVGLGQTGGFIYTYGGTLVINWVHFDGTKTTGVHATNGGCIYVGSGAKVTIKEYVRIAMNGMPTNILRCR